MVYCTSHTKSSFPWSYSLLCWKNSTTVTRARRAREVMYWPGMQAAILQQSAKCSLCASYGSALPKESDVVSWNSTRYMEIYLAGPIQVGWALVFCYSRPLQWLVWGRSVEWRHHCCPCYLSHKGALCPLWYTRYIFVRQWTSVSLSGIFKFCQDLWF